jgi:hypothetical protein
MPPRITYDTTGATAGTEIVFTKPTEEIVRNLVTERNRNKSDNGNWETIERYTEQEFEVKFTNVPQAERDNYETFYTAWATLGKAFLFWPTTANESTYYTVKLKDDDWRARPIGANIIDRHEWTHTFRRTI